ncbi:MAG: class I SAM-dependent methyltransferase [Phycisphaerales bacterium]|nr:MAG: class I SAM-dependent methyltransferase [Phycisphaerales bacterium]
MNPVELVAKLITTLYEDDHVLAVAKPAGIDVGGGERQSTASVIEIVRRARGDRKPLDAITRLSRYESGVVLLGKDPETIRHIRSGMRAGRVRQDYLAVATGRMAKPQLAIDPGYGTSRGKQGRMGSRGKGQRESRRKPVEPRTRPTNARRSDDATFVRLVRAGEKRLLIRCHTTAATTHTLRAQLRAVGLRVISDDARGASRGRGSVANAGLHLEKVSFRLPHRKTTCTIKCRPPATFANVLSSKRETAQHLHAALVHRLPLILDGRTDSYRLLTGKERINGLSAEKYGEVVVLQIRQEHASLTEALPEIARWYLRTLGVTAVYVKHFARTGGTSCCDARHSPSSARPFVGDEVPGEIEILEHGLRFIIRPYDGPSVGLFLDQRDNRQQIRRLAGGKSVLNLFAYTCGFSVAAAAGNAAKTTSVDISGKALEWGRANFLLNGMDSSEHEFFTADSMSFLKRARRQERHFDMIILDPPSFAHGRKRKEDFSVARDLPTLVRESSAVLKPGGVMMVSTNYRRLSRAGLRDLLEEGAGRRRCEIVSVPRLPPDFLADSEYAKTIFARFD